MTFVISFAHSKILQNLSDYRILFENNREYQDTMVLN